MTDKPAPTIEERLTRLEDNQRRHLALTNELDVYLAKIEVSLGKTDRFLDHVARKQAETAGLISASLERIDNTLLAITERVEVALRGRGGRDDT
jgi:hypothetical protein